MSPEKETEKEKEKEEEKEREKRKRKRKNNEKEGKNKEEGEKESRESQGEGKKKEKVMEKEGGKEASLTPPFFPKDLEKGDTSLEENAYSDKEEVYLSPPCTPISSLSPPNLRRRT
ncbi:MAG: hypothetical protein COB69_10615, partial [Phycisphaera sp.]